jgi:hypothetical protein
VKLLIAGGKVSCPGCGLTLSKLREQDKRVWTMIHPPSESCRWSNRTLRVSLSTGDAEEVEDVVTPESP